MKLRVYNINDIKKYKKLLRSKCQDVLQFNQQLKSIVETMIKTNTLYSGIGLAAPQIGILKNIVIIDRFPHEYIKDLVSFPLILINPTFKTISFEKEISIQGCLSVPRKLYKVERFKTIFVTAKDLNGNNINFEANDLLSYCIQHQLDHLQGKLICDIGKETKIG